MTVQTVELAGKRFVIMLEKDYRRLQRKGGEVDEQELGDIAEVKRRKASGSSRPYSELRKKLGLQMSYRLLYGPGVERDMSRLPRKALVQIDRAITALTDNPRPIGCLKMSGGEGLWRVRVGVYRIVYEIDDTEQTVVIRVLAQRQDVYRGL